MHANLEFLIGLLDQEGPPDVAAEDLDGPHEAALRTLRTMRILRDEPGANPVSSCPHCDEGVPYLLGERYLCNRCFSTVDRRQLLLWRLDRDAFLGWLAVELRLRGEVRRIDACLWQLGTSESADTGCEWFFRRRGRLTDVGHRRLLAYRSALVLYGIDRPKEEATVHATYVSLLEMLRLGESLTVINRTHLLRNGGDVRFDPQSGAVTVGDTWLGEVPVGSKEYHLLRCLAQQLDRFVPYADIKHFVSQQTGSRDSADEASFCQDLKRRAKKTIPGIDRLIVTTNKGEGYRLRRRVVV